MKHVLPTLLALLVAFTSLGQAYHPFIRSGVYWDNVYVDATSICQAGHGYRLYFPGTTVSVGGQQYHELYGHPYVTGAGGCPPYRVDMARRELVMLMREDTTTRRVYWRNTAPGSTEKLLYDFGLGAGDTLVIPGIGYRIVDSVGTMALLNGQARRASYLDFYNGGHPDDVLLESIGSNFGPMSPFPGMGIGFYYRLEAVWENGVLVWGQAVHPLGTATELTAAPVVTFDAATRALQCQLPNPGPAALRLLDVAGRVVFAQSLNGGVTVALPPLSPGLYFYELTAGPRRVAGRCLLAD